MLRIELNSGITQIETVAFDAAFIDNNVDESRVDDICLKKCSGSSCDYREENCNKLSIESISAASNGNLTVRVSPSNLIPQSAIEGYELVIGESSTGIVETTTFTCPTNTDCYIYVYYRDANGCLVSCCIKVRIPSDYSPTVTHSS